MLIFIFMEPVLHGFKKKEKKAGTRVLRFSKLRSKKQYLEAGSKHSDDKMKTQKYF